MGALVSLLCAARSSRVLPRLHFAPSPARVAVKPSVTSEADEQPKEGLDGFIAARCPSLHREFSPAWWLFK